MGKAKLPWREYPAKQRNAVLKFLRVEAACAKDPFMAGELDADLVDALRAGIRALLEMKV